MTTMEAFRAGYRAAAARSEIAAPRITWGWWDWFGMAAAIGTAICVMT